MMIVASASGEITVISGTHPVHITAKKMAGIMILHVFISSSSKFFARALHGRKQWYGNGKQLMHVVDPRENRIRIP